MPLSWNERYVTAGVDRPIPPDALSDRLDGVDRSELVPTRGAALDVACGRGGVAVWLALRGLAVDAVDAAPAGLHLGAQLADRHGVDVRWHEADLDAGLPVPGRYDVVVCQRFRDPVLYPALARATAPSGLLVVSVLSEVGGGPGRFCAAAGELRQAFGAFAVLLDVEGHGEAALVARRPST